MDNEIHIFTDGGSRGNPGPAAIGVYIENQEGRKHTGIGKKIGEATNNVAEYKAVIEAFSWTLDHKEDFPQGTKILFFLDSLLVCSQMKGAWKIKDENLRSLYFTAKKKEEVLGFQVSYTHIPREKNKKADELVNAALDNML